MKKFKSVLPDIFLLVYIIACGLCIITYTTTKDKLMNSGTTPTFKQVMYNIFHGDIEPPTLEMPYMPGSYHFDYNDPSISYNQVKAAIEASIPDEFEWKVSEEYEYITLKKGWTLSPKDNPIMIVISRDPYIDGQNGIGSDTVKARYNQTCSMRDVSYGTKIWLKGSNTAIVFVVTDNNCAENEIVLHQRDKLGELDGEYEVVKCSPPTTNYIDGVSSIEDWNNLYSEWKRDTQKELDGYEMWRDIKETLNYKGGNNNA